MLMSTEKPYHLKEERDEDGVYDVYLKKVSYHADGGSQLDSKNDNDRSTGTKNKLKRLFKTSKHKSDPTLQIYTDDLLTSPDPDTRVHDPYTTSFKPDASNEINNNNAKNSPKTVNRQYIKNINNNNGHISATRTIWPTARKEKAKDLNMKDYYQVVTRRSDEVPTPTADDTAGCLRWTLKEVKVIKCGTLRGLVRALTYHDTGELDATHVNVFLGTYRTFASSLNVMKCIMDRYKEVLEMGGAKKTFKDNILKALKTVLLIWMNTYPNDFLSNDAVLPIGCNLGSQTSPANDVSPLGMITNETRGDRMIPSNENYLFKMLTIFLNEHLDIREDLDKQIALSFHKLVEKGYQVQPSVALKLSCNFTKTALSLGHNNQRSSHSPESTTSNYITATTTPTSDTAEVSATTVAASDPRDFFKQSSRSMAELLTFIDAELFRNVSLHECLGSVWGKRYSTKKQTTAIPPQPPSSSSSSSSSSSLPSSAAISKFVNPSLPSSSSFTVSSKTESPTNVTLPTSSSLPSLKLAEPSKPSVSIALTTLSPTSSLSTPPPSSLSSSQSSSFQHHPLSSTPVSTHYSHLALPIRCPLSALSLSPLSPSSSLSSTSSTSLSFRSALYSQTSSSSIVLSPLSSPSLPLPPPSSPQSSSSPLSSVRDTIEQFNAVAYRVVASIIAPSLNEPERVQSIEKWIDIAQECRKLKNFSSLKAIIAALQSCSIHKDRHEHTWSLVSRHHIEMFDNLQELTSDVDNCQSSRDVLNKEGTAKSAEVIVSGKKKWRNQIVKMLRKGILSGNLFDPSSTTDSPTFQGTVPYLGTFLTDLAMIDTAYKEFLDVDVPSDRAEENGGNRSGGEYCSGGGNNACSRHTDNSCSGDCSDVSYKRDMNDILRKSAASIADKEDFSGDKRKNEMNKKVKMINFKKKQKEWEVMVNMKIYQNVVRFYKITPDMTAYRWLEYLPIYDESTSYKMSLAPKVHQQVSSSSASTPLSSRFQQVISSATHKLSSFSPFFSSSSSLALSSQLSVSMLSLNSLSSSSSSSSSTPPLTSRLSTFENDAVLMKYSPFTMDSKIILPRDHDDSNDDKQVNVHHKDCHQTVSHHHHHPDQSHQLRHIPRSNDGCYVTKL